MSMLLISSYVFDWVFLIVLAVIGYLVGNLTPNKRPFSLDNSDISFPYKGHDTVSLTVLLIVSVIGSAAIIFLVAVFFVPGPSAVKGPSRAQLWRRKLWEWHVGWLGLAMSTVISWFFVSSMKNLFGKPRPNLLNRCKPDFANITKYVVGDIANTSNIGRLVSAEICQNTDKSVIDEGFRSFPSGHSAFSAAGLVYLSLFLAAKLWAAPASLPPSSSPGMSSSESTDHATQINSTQGAANTSDPPGRRYYHKLTGEDNSNVSAREQAAGAPVYLLVISMAPFAAAVFICSSRWYDFQHHGFDILFGFLIGTLSSLLAFRHYHLPPSRGAGWSWGPRQKHKAFWAGVGSEGYLTRTPILNRSSSQEPPQGWGSRGLANSDEHESYQLQAV
ncbi:Fc.00g026570.m01.CDS01 [Cosmosporella sp. VM-42]